MTAPELNKLLVPEFKLFIHDLYPELYPDAPSQTFSDETPARNNLNATTFRDKFATFQGTAPEAAPGGAGQTDGDEQELV